VIRMLPNFADFGFTDAKDLGDYVSLRDLMLVWAVLSTL
jgi:hypothetical protein